MTFYTAVIFLGISVTLGTEGQVATAVRKIPVKQFTPGEYVVTMTRTPLMDEDRELLKVEVDTVLLVKAVNDIWISVDVEHENKMVSGGNAYGRFRKSWEIS